MTINDCENKSGLTSKYKDGRITFNVSGDLYETHVTTLGKYPDTLLGSEERRLQILDGSRGEIFLNRNRQSFEAILFFYQSCGKLIRPPSIPMPQFEEECNFYRLPQEAINRMKERELYVSIAKRPHPDEYRHLRSPGIFKIWIFLNFPVLFSSPCAMFFAAFNYFLVILSVAVFCFQKEIDFMLRLIIMRYPYASPERGITSERIEYFLHLFFIAELTLQIFVCPRLKIFLSDWLNVIEAMSVFPYFSAYYFPEPYVRFVFMSCLRVLRTFRLFRLGIFQPSIRAACRVARASLSDLAIVVFLSLVSCVTSASIVYHFEVAHNAQFSSIPESMWWAWQTMFCLGYGDIIPVTVLGKVASAAVAILGIVTMAVLILSLGGRSFDLFKHFLEMEESPSEGKRDSERDAKTRDFSSAKLVSTLDKKVTFKLPYAVRV